MSNLDSWEDDQDAQQQPQQNNALRAGAGSFRPDAMNFQPGGNFPQYGAGQQQYGQYYQQGGYPQYNQGYGGQPGYPQYNQQYGQQFPQYGQQAYQHPNAGMNQQPRQQAPISIAKRPDGNSQQNAAPAPAPAAAPAPAKAPSGDSVAPKMKTLSITADPPKPKVETAGQTKVLSLGVPAAPKAEPKPTEEKGPKAAEAGAKAKAAKAIEKTGESTGKTSPSPASGRDSPGRADPKGVKSDAVAQELEAAANAEILKEMDLKEHVNVIFLGHVDAGKSTLGGSILVATGQVDERTLEKWKQDAKAAGRETWYLSWALDLTKEERSKGKTVEVGRGFFETDKRRYSILDAPGHKNYVPSMLGGAAQADVGVLVISARKGEFETGFERGGQTREHAMLAKTQGVNKLIVVINKMDDPTVEWAKTRYDEIITKITPYLKGIGYNPKNDLFFMPVSAQTLTGIKERVPSATCKWWDGPALLEYLDNMQALERKLAAPFMMPVSAKYKDMGTMIEGKVEAGIIDKSKSYVMMPNKETVNIVSLYGESEDEIPKAFAGDQIRLRLRGIEEEDILPGYVLCSPSRPVHYVSSFDAQIHILPELKSILSAGYNGVMHVHTAQVEVTFAALLHKLEKGTGRKSKKPPGFATKGMQIIARLEIVGGTGSVCIERYEDYAQMGRFTIRDQGTTIAIGKVLKLNTD